MIVVWIFTGSYKVTISDAAGCTASALANITQPDSSAPSGSNGSSGGTASSDTSGQSGVSTTPLAGHRELSSSARSATLWNQGTAIYVQHAALVSVKGDFINQNSTTTGSVYNDGVMELTGNFDNDSGAVFTTGTNNSSTDRAVKFIGSSKQVITGAMSGSQSSFYNLVIDQAAASDTVEMQTPVAVQGSIVFGTANTTSTYNPSSTYTNHNQKGLFKTYSDTLGEFLLDLQNGNPDAIAGYPVLEMGMNPNTGFIVTSGLRGTASGGLQRKISSATSYLFPIGTADKGFNGMRLNFAQVPGNGSVKAKFCSGSSQSDGFVGTISQFCDGCAQGETPTEAGFSKYFASNECNNGAPQWVSFANTLAHHGYWSLASTNTGYAYDLEVFPNSYGYLDPYNVTRVIKHEAAYNVDPSGSSVDWRPEIESLCSSANDLLTYTKNAGCYNGGGIPGGIYRDFSHFSIGTSGGSTALPVQMLYITAEPTGKHHILVSWATALEINNQGFFVMRSLDGVNFSDIGWVVGHNNSTVTNTYTYDDRPSQNAVYYYKLRQIDNNGKFSFSNIAEAKLSDQTAQDFALYPNPTASDIFLQVNNPSEEVRVDIYDIKGQLVYNNIFTIENTGSQQTLTIHASSEMTLGTYILTASTNGEKYSAKVILQ